MVRREGEERGEERLGRRRELLAHELQEGFVPDAPVSVEVVPAVARLVVLAADEPLDARRAGVGAESHRAALRAAEERRGIAHRGEDRRELAAGAERLGHQHEGRAERGDAPQHRGHGLDRARAVGVHPREGQPAAHQRVEEGRESLHLAVGVDLRAEPRGVLGRHALHDEYHDVATREVDGRAVGGCVHGREVPRELLLREVLHVLHAAAVPGRAQDAEGVAQDQVGLHAVRGVEHGVREGDRPCHACHAAPGPGDAEPCGQGEQQRPAGVIGPAAAEQALLTHPPAVSPCQQGDHRRAEEPEQPVFGQELRGQLQGVAVVGEEDLVGREAFLRIVEVDRVGDVRGDDQHGVDRDVVSEAEVPPPAPLAHVQRHE